MVQRGVLMKKNVEGDYIWELVAVHATLEQFRHGSASVEVSK
jgi:hypothetical protein